MKRLSSRSAAFCFAAACSSLLIACGGGGGGGGGSTTPPAPTQVGMTDVPIAATQDSSVAFSFIAMVVAAGEANTATPLVLSDATNDPVLATSETADPMPVAA